MKSSKKGISLIVLVITIIVIIILAAAVILTLTNNNPISDANKARYSSDVANMQALVTNTVAKIMAEKQSTIKIVENKALYTTAMDKATPTKGVATIQFTLDASVDNASGGTILFGTATGTPPANTYYTGKLLPIYAAGDTIWEINTNGALTLTINGKDATKDL